MARKVVYDGATGGLGRHLASALAEIGVPSSPLLARLGEVEQVRREFREAARNAESMAFIQAAAMVPVGDCKREPLKAYDVNVVRTLRTIGAFLDETELAGIDGLIVYTSSAHIYAEVEPGVRIREDAPTGPKSIYAETKLAVEQELRSLASTRGARVVIARVFGLLGPGQRNHYLLPNLIQRAKAREVHGIPGLDNVRDYLDARDIAFYLGLLASGAVKLDAGEVVVVNVCSGEAISVRALLDQVLRCLYGHSSEYRALSSKVSAAPGRSTDLPWLVGDSTLLRRITGVAAVRRIQPAETVTNALEE